MFKVRGEKFKGELIFLVGCGDVFKTIVNLIVNIYLCEEMALEAQKWSLF